MSFCLLELFCSWLKSFSMTTMGLSYAWDTEGNLSLLGTCGSSSLLKECINFEFTVTASRLLFPTKGLSWYSRHSHNAQGIASLISPFFPAFPLPFRSFFPPPFPPLLLWRSFWKKYHESNKAKGNVIFCEHLTREMFVARGSVSNEFYMNCLYKKKHLDFFFLQLGSRALMNILIYAS